MIPIDHWGQPLSVVVIWHLWWLFCIKNDINVIKFIHCAKIPQFEWMIIIITFFDIWKHPNSGWKDQGVFPECLTNRKFPNPAVTESLISEELSGHACSVTFCRVSPLVSGELPDTVFSVTFYRVRALASGELPGPAVSDWITDFRWIAKSCLRCYLLHCKTTGFRGITRSCCLCEPMKCRSTGFRGITRSCSLLGWITCFRGIIR